MSLTYEPASEPLHISVKWFHIACVQVAFCPGRAEGLGVRAGEMGFEVWGSGLGVKG